MPERRASCFQRFTVFGLPVWETGNHRERNGGGDQNLPGNYALLSMKMGMSPGCHGGYFFITASNRSDFNNCFNQCLSET